MPIDLLLFDLDNTLIHSEDLEPFRGAAGIGPRTSKAVSALLTACRKNSGRHHYTADDLAALREGRRIGVFTRAPRAYADTLLAELYPSVHWDIVIGYEDVRNTKPHPDGVWLAMKQLGTDHPSKVALVGDHKTDIITAYRAGCWAFLDQGTWPVKWQSEHYYAIERVADVVFDGPRELRERINNPVAYLPELERAGSAGQTLDHDNPRYDNIGHWMPRGIGRERTFISVLGRSFSGYEELRHRIAWHQLTHEIGDLKDATKFPDHWIAALRNCIAQSWPIQHARPTVITVVPFKPGRTPRLERLLAQLAQTDRDDPIAPPLTPMEFMEGVLRYREGVRGHSSEHLSRDERFINVRDHLEVARPDDVDGKHVIVIDDVATTGASLVYADLYLRAAGALNVNCMALAKAIGPQ